MTMLEASTLITTITLCNFSWLLGSRAGTQKAIASITCDVEHLNCINPIVTVAYVNYTIDLKSL